MNPFKKKKNEAEQILILDSCGLIDGRIVDIARIGFVPQNILIPQFIIAELQFLADHGDSHKRERARYGLDVIKLLQDLRRTNVEIAREQFKNIREVDDKLIALAKEHGAMLYTTDFNLNKVAQIEGVEVLNVNELAQAMRPSRLPGEKVEIKITQVGQDRTQGVGYLEDGTMVVVERAGNKIGQRLHVEFSRMLQTAAGKMMFAVLPKTDVPEPIVSKPIIAPSDARVNDDAKSSAVDNDARIGKVTDGSLAHEQHHRPRYRRPVGEQSIDSANQTRSDRPRVARAPRPRQAQPRPASSTSESTQPQQAPAAASAIQQPRPPQRRTAAPRNNNAGRPQQQQQPRQNNRRRITPEDSFLSALSRSEQE